MNGFAFIQMITAAWMAKMAWEHNVLAMVIFAVMFAVAWFMQTLQEDKRSRR